MCSIGWMQYREIAGIELSGCLDSGDVLRMERKRVEHGK
jgi:hypothetical protein